MNKINNNSAGLSGGGIYCNSSHPRIAKNTIGSNSASISGGGIFCKSSQSTINGNVITGNRADYFGGGLYLISSNQTTMSNNTISNNTAHFYGGGLYSCNNSAIKVVNTILWADSSARNSEIYLENDSIAISFSDIQGGWEGSWNNNMNPLFVDPENGDYHLQEGSPCIDAGDPNSPFDPDSTISDMGALYFYQGGGNGISIIADPIDPPIIVSQGSSFNYYGYLINTTDTDLTTDVWCRTLMPDGSLSDTIRVWSEVSVAANSTIEDFIVQYIPTYASLGDYLYIIYDGDYPNIMNSAYFPFTVIAATEGLAGSDRGWEVSGWGGKADDMDAVNIPAKLTLKDNYPNPFNAQTTITYQLPKAGDVSLDIYNLMGQKVATLVNGNVEAGSHTVVWNAGYYSSGIYFYKLTAGNKVFTKRMTLLK